MLQILEQYDENQTGYIPDRALLAASAACNILLTDKEEAYVLSQLDPDNTKAVSINTFVSKFCC